MQSNQKSKFSGEIAGVLNIFKHWNKLWLTDRKCSQNSWLRAFNMLQLHPIGPLARNNTQPGPKSGRSQLECAGRSHRRVSQSDKFWKESSNTVIGLFPRLKHHPHLSFGRHEQIKSIWVETEGLLEWCSSPEYRVQMQFEFLLDSVLIWKVSLKSVVFFFCSKQMSNYKL